MYSFRSFAKPPPPVQTVCECIVVLRGYKEISWKTAKGMMSETNFLSSLTTLDVDGINQGQVNNLCSPIQNIDVVQGCHTIVTRLISELEVTVSHRPFSDNFHA